MTTRRSDSPSPLRRWPASPRVVALGGLLVMAAGCREPLFTESQTRSPFHRYDRVRNQDAQPYVQDEYGRSRPNIIGRLSPR